MFAVWVRPCCWIGTVLVGGWLAGCATVRKSPDITALDRIYYVPGKQNLRTRTDQGQERTVTLLRGARAALYERGDTLYTEFVPHTLQPDDNNSYTLDQSDSAAVTFFHSHMRPNASLETLSPWFYYQLTSFDLDLLAFPFKYRLPQPQRAGELSTSANLGVYTGIRYDLGRYRTITYRYEQRSQIESFSFGIGTILSIDPVTVNEFNTNGRFTSEYDAFGWSYGLAAIVGYKSVTTGLSVGFENLADRNNRLWVYRQKPWLGIAVGINLN